MKSSVFWIFYISVFLIYANLFFEFALFAKNEKNIPMNFKCLFGLEIFWLSSLTSLWNLEDVN